MNYKVLKRIWHRGDERIYEPGATVSLWHLEREEIKLLVSKGVVERPAPKKPRAGTSKKTVRVSKKKPVIKPVIKKKPVIENMEENK